MNNMDVNIKKETDEDGLRVVYLKKFNFSNLSIGEELVERFDKLFFTDCSFSSLSVKGINAETKVIVFKNCKFLTVDFISLRFSGLIFKRCELSKVTFSENDMGLISFKKSVLSDVHIKRVNMRELIFHEGTITNLRVTACDVMSFVSFEMDAVVKQVKFTNNLINQLNFDMSVNFRGWDFSMDQNKVTSFKLGLFKVTPDQILNFWVKNDQDKVLNTKPHTLKAYAPPRVMSRVSKFPKYYQGDKRSYTHTPIRKKELSRSPAAGRKEKQVMFKLQKHTILTDGFASITGLGFKLDDACDGFEDGINGEWVKQMVLSGLYKTYIVASSNNVEKIYGIIVFQKMPSLNFRETIEIIALCSKRGYGLGETLVNYVNMHIVKNYPSVKYMILDAVKEAQPFYEKIGFRYTSSECDLKKYKFCSLIRNKKNVAGDYMYKPVVAPGPLYEGPTRGGV